MKTISENIKYPEFKEQYNGGEWITGHLVRMEGSYLHHSKRVVTMYTEEELPEVHRESVSAYEVKKAEENAGLIEMVEIIRARVALQKWAEDNAKSFTLSNKSESKYYYVEHEGFVYKIRISGHRYPTGSMTDMHLFVIDATDDCRKYCRIFNIKY